MNKKLILILMLAANQKTTAASPLTDIVSALAHEAVMCVKDLGKECADYCLFYKIRQREEDCKHLFEEYEARYTLPNADPDYLNIKKACGHTAVNFTETKTESLARTIALFDKLALCHTLYKDKINNLNPEVHAYYEHKDAATIPSRIKQGKSADFSLESYADYLKELNKKNLLPTLRTFLYNFSDYFCLESDLFDARLVLTPTVYKPSYTKTLQTILNSCKEYKYTKHLPLLCEFKEAETGHAAYSRSGRQTIHFEHSIPGKELLFDGKPRPKENYCIDHCSLSRISSVVKHELSHLLFPALSLYIECRLDKKYKIQKHVTEEIKADTYAVFNSPNPIQTAHALTEELEYSHEWHKIHAANFYTNTLIPLEVPRLERLAWIIKHLEKELAEKKAAQKDTEKVRG